MVDFNGQILCLFTNIPGKVHDNLSARYNIEFSRILGGDHWLIGDSAFNGISYVVPGFRRSQLHLVHGRLMFDKISREEQKVVESVNKFVKDARSLNKLDVFRHSDDKLLACVFIGAGFYNLKRSWGYYCSK